MIELFTLGALELTSAESNALGSVLAQPRRAALLCYLALALPRGFQRRDTLSALFWPEDDAEQARHALRQSVYFLRRALGADTIVSRGDDELAVAPEQLHCDVWAFDAAVDEGRPSDALAVYRGELLAGFHISGAPEFEHWLDQERARVRRLAVEAGWALALQREREGDAAGAAEAGRWACSLVPEDETAIRRLMLLLERLGDRVAVMHAYEAFAVKLEEEYELQPSAETQALVARIRDLPSAPGNGNARAVPTMESSTSPGTKPAAPASASPASPRYRVRRLTAIAWAAGVLLLLTLAGLSLRTRSRDPRLGAPRPPAGEVAPGIGVLPFAVQDDSLANWREGLVDLVSINLSGVPGLRSVDSRTLLARWRERVKGTDIPELATALDVAERAGARYAVVGSVIADGGDLLLTASLHQVDGRQMLGAARSQGPADSILTLVDRLTSDILRLILRGEAGELPRIDLARVSTSSLPALKSYLEGEVLFRRSQFQSAAEAYARAVDADSTFALARYRLGLSRWWFSTATSGPVRHPLEAEVGRFADRLPPHEAAILRAILLRERDVPAARELLEGEARRHPDDAETWHELGELYYHDGGPAVVSPEVADRTFARAIELDSTFTLPYIHRIEHAISAGDTASAARLLDTFTRLAPESRYVGWFRLVTRLAFGDAPARSAAEAALDTLASNDLIGLGLALQGQRCCWERAEDVFRRARGRDEIRPVATIQLFWTSLAQGKLHEALEWVDDPFMPEDRKGPLLLVLDEFGAAIPASRLDSALAIGARDSAAAFRMFYAGFYAAVRGRWPVLRGLLERLESHERRLRAAGDSSEAGFTGAVQQALEGYALWRRGRRDTALVLLEGSQRRVVGDWRRQMVGVRLRWWLGQLLLEMRRPREGLAYFETLTGSSLPANYERGRIYERLGQREDAREAYGLFLALRQHADPAFQPMIQDARAALQRLAVEGAD